MIDFFATTSDEWVQETKTASTTVLTYEDFSSLTSRATDARISGVRVQCSSKFRYTLDGSDPTTTTGFYQMPDYPVDYHISTWEQLKIIRDGTTDSSITVAPLHISI